MIYSMLLFGLLTAKS